MRYRPFGISGKAVSAVSLLLREPPGGLPVEAWRNLIVGAMENGINAFELVAGSRSLAQGLFEAARTVERRLLFVGWRICGREGQGVSAHQISQSVREGLQQTGVGYFDLLTLDEMAAASLSAQAVELLQNLRASGLALQIGVAGEGSAAEAAVLDPTFDALCSPFHLLCDGRLRRRVKEAAANNMSVMGCAPFPPDLNEAAGPAPAPQKLGFFRRAPAPAPGPAASPYAFLHETRGWRADELCLGYALTEPAFASVQIETLDSAELERLAAVADRDLPTGVAAQIEMARFGAVSQPERRRA